VDQATSGEEAIELIERNSSDLVLLDVLLPGLSGLQVLDLLRDSESDMSIVLTTAHGSERLAVDALRRGADDYLRKPLVARELEMTVTRTLARLSLRRQNYVLQQQLNEKRYQLEAELARAAQVQADLLPRTAPDLPGYELAAACLPAREVGGDFYDWHPVIDGKVTITLGDVMGKGMPAALLMATVRAVLRSAVGADQPDLTVNHVAETLGPDLDRAESFVTLFHAQLELATGQIDFVDAGHGCSFVRRFDGSFDADLEPCGAPVGVPYAPPIEMGTIQLDLGDVLVLYSDGLLEVRPELLVHGPSVLAEVLRAATSAQEIVACLAALAAPVVALPDDLTIVVLRRLPL
jgi:serine phosphatase RsbU (regulator of sigma subunit)